MLRPEGSFGGARAPSRRSTSTTTVSPFAKRSMVTPTHAMMALSSAYASAQAPALHPPLAALSQQMISLSEDRYFAASSSSARTPLPQPSSASPTTGGQDPPTVRPCSGVKYDAEFEYPCDVLDADMILKTPDRVDKRVRQVVFHGKGTQGYKNYAAAVPKSMRQIGNDMHPVTPRVACCNSKRRFDQIVSAWRIALHKWDISDGSARMMDNSDGKHPTWADAGVVLPNDDDDTQLECGGPPVVERTLNEELMLTPQTESRQVAQRTPPPHQQISSAMKPTAAVPRMEMFKHMLENAMQHAHQQSQADQIA